MAKTKKTKKDAKSSAGAEPKDVTEEELGEGELDQVSGGVGLLLPAVQKAREAASTALPTAEVSLKWQKVRKK